MEEYFSKFGEYQAGAGSKIDSVVQELSEHHVHKFMIICMLTICLYISKEEQMSKNLTFLLISMKHQGEPHHSVQICVRYADNIVT